MKGWIEDWRRWKDMDGKSTKQEARTRNKGEKRDGDRLDEFLGQGE